jgi:protein-tyrosine phosphatase
MMKRLKHWLQGSEAGPTEAPRLRLLMVCMGNICRSPTAEGVMRVKLQRAGLHGLVQVDSAGTHGYHTGEAPDPRAVRHAAQRGYDIAGLRARPVGPEDFVRFDWLLAMDEDNLAWLQKRAPQGATARLEPLMSYALHNPRVASVPDPYYGAAAGFERVLDLVEDACDGVLRGLQAELARAQVQGFRKA